MNDPNHTDQPSQQNRRYRRMAIISFILCMCAITILLSLMFCSKYIQMRIYRYKLYPVDERIRTVKPNLVLLVLFCAVVSIALGVYARKRIEIKPQSRRIRLFALMGIICGSLLIPGALIYIASDIIVGGPQYIIRRLHSDMHVIGHALEDYRADHGAYPAWSTNQKLNVGTSEANTPTFQIRSHDQMLASLTTPVAYIFSFSPQFIVFE